MKTKILVTGCAGFIGSHLCEKLLALNYEVIGIDNFDPFYGKAIKEQNLSEFINHTDFTFLELDLRDYDSLIKNLPKGIQLITHLAAKAGVRPSIENPRDYMQVNVAGTNNVLEAMLEKNIKKLFFASSSSIYGNQKEVPFKENKIDYQPISPYAFNKRSCELMNFTYHHLHQLDIINARFFTVYGPRQRPDLAIHKFVRLIDENKTIPMFGDGSTSRDYTYISDTISGVVSSIEYLIKNDDVFETFNLGNSTPIQLKELIHTISTAMQKDVQINQLPMQEGDVDITFADINKANDLVGYQPQIKLPEGIKNFIAWYNKKKVVQV
ncbi:MAG: NAD-dependent epimerase/dehydratase family protein [Bacteroidia bacterium]|nr:GDP-mannose 4,6-dehydratase [Bacteroidia bacterium]NNC85561.1 NAD-dependent epimerase/dehydratase family protein [Bacteroidia bacterium]NNM15109.1 NAD-dependent epimerase/dehydratase family protein [Bacteroidia bacterium]